MKNESEINLSSVPRPCVHALVERFKARFCNGQEEQVKFLCIVGKGSDIELKKQCLVNEKVKILITACMFGRREVHFV